MSLWYSFCSALARNLFFRPFGGFEIIGGENVPSTGALLVTPIHVSHIDPPLLGSVFPRQLCFMAKRELFKGFLGWFLPSVGGFPVGRGEGDLAAIRQALDVLSQRKALLLFPEGTRGDAVRLGAIQSGVAMLAKRSGAAIVPVGIGGTQKMLPKGAKKPKPTKITLVIGKPIRYADYSGLPDKQARTTLLADLEQSLLELSHRAGLNLLPPLKSDAPD